MSRFATLVASQLVLMPMERFLLLAMSAIFLFAKSAFSMILRKAEMFACAAALHLMVSSISVAFTLQEFESQ